jgi:hypothetical protein
MSRRKSTLKHAVELYLIIVGGGYTLTSVVALIYNAQGKFQQESTKIS